MIQFLINYFLSDVKVVFSFRHYSERKRSITEMYVLAGHEFQFGIPFVRER